MDFKDNILQIAERISKQKDAILTEEATKTAFVMPMIAALGYDVFNPFEVIPEMDCDIVKKKGEKVDYAIMKDDKPILLIECKHCKVDLNLHDTQLQRYFISSNARFGVLTNGIEYRFYTDLDKTNIMDEKPFLVVDMSDLNDECIEQLKCFHKSYYNESDILGTANELKYTTEIKSIFNNEISTPSNDFIRFFVRQTYTGGQITQRVIDMFAPLVKKSILSVINDIISDRLKNAIKNEEIKQEPVIVADKETDEKENLPEGVVFIDKEHGIVTSTEEIDSYNIVRSILREIVDVSRIKYKDNKNYFVINLDGGYWWICRLSLGIRKKYICFSSDPNNWISIESIDDIFKYKEQLEDSLKKILEK